jgi:hypothetical protein
MKTKQNSIRKYFWFIGDWLDRLPSPLKEIANGAYFCVLFVTAFAVILALGLIIAASLGFTLKLVGIATPLFISSHPETPFLNLVLIGMTYSLVLVSMVGIFFLIGSALSGETK